MKPIAWLAGLFLALNAGATQQLMLVGSPVETSSPACSTSSSTNSWNRVIEGWEAAGGENPWTLYLSPAGRTDIAFDRNADTSALTSNKPPGACNQAFHLLWYGTNATANSYYWDSGATITNTPINIECAIYCPTGCVGNLGFISVGNSTYPETTRAAMIGMYGVASSTTSILFYAYGSSAAANITLSAGQWHWVKVHLDAAGAASASYIKAGASSNSFTRSSLSSRYVHVGAASYLSVGDIGDLYVDLIAVSTNSP